MSDSASFTVKLVNQVTAPARAVTKSMGDVGKAFADTQAKLAAPSPKRGALSDWDKMLAKAKMSQRADFAKLLPKKPPPALEKPPGFGEIVGGVVTGEAIVDGLKAVAFAAWDAVKGVVELGAKFVETAVEAAMFAERSTLAIGFLTDNTQQAGNTFDMVRKEAQGLGLEVNETVVGFQKLLAAQFNVGQSNALIKMGADMQAIGASAEEVQRIIFAMTEIKSIGTLQKRQQRMLQMAGVSGELIDKALMARTGINSKAGLDKARKGGKIDADTAILAIQDAIKLKTHEKNLGDSGKVFADTTLQGMSQKLAGGVHNFFTDVGERMLGGLTTMAGLLSGTIGKLMSDPQLAELGTFLLNRFEIFTLWVQANWPTIEGMLIDGFHAIADAIRFTVNLLDMSDTTWKVIGYTLLGLGITLGLLAAALAVVAIGGFLLTLPLLLLAAAFGLVIAGIVLGIEWLYAEGQKLVGFLSKFGIGDGADAGQPAGVQGVNVSGVTNALKSADGKTEGGTITMGHTIHVAQLSLQMQGGDGDDETKARKIGAMIRSEIEKQLHQVA